MTRYAETWTDIGRLPLRRRDRAAMVLALECCREDGVHVTAAVVSARRSLSEGGDVACQILGASNLVSAHEHGRLVCARLALLLRVLLRVDAGNLPWWRCPEHGRRVTFDWSETHNREEWWCPSCRKWFVTEMYPPTRAVRPLWEAAR